jgi:predicted glycosyltransferase
VVTTAVREATIPEASRAAASIAPKILFYSHDTFGLGNIRRTLLLSHTLADEYPRASMLVVTGSPMIHDFRIPANLDYIKLPCLDRTDSDCYEPKFLCDQSVEVNRIRRAILVETVTGFRPDLMIVDKRPGGVGGELVDALRALRRRLDGTRVVLGMRDILDEPERTRASLKRTRDMETIARYYDEVWIYGEHAIFDPVVEYAFDPAVARKTRFCGYLRRPSPPALPRHEGPPRVLVTTGGGADGAPLITAYLEGLSMLPRVIELRTTVVFGPHVDAASRRAILQRFGALADVEFLDFEPDLAAHYARADVVVAMAGYNTVCELLSFRRPAVLVPRATPVGEQLLRARLLAARGYFDYVEPDQLVPAVLMDRVLDAVKRPPAAAPIDLDGLPRIRERVRTLLARRSDRQGDNVMNKGHEDTKARSDGQGHEGTKTRRTSGGGTRVPAHGV